MSINKLQWAGGIFFATVSMLLLVTSAAEADQIQMQNGDRFMGRLIAFTNDTLIVQSESLGTLRLPRSKIAQVTFGTVAATPRIPLSTPTNQLHPVGGAVGKADSDLSAALRQLNADTNSLQKIQQQFLSTAGPEANKKFTDVAESLMAGKMNISDIRAEASSAVNQLRALKREQGEDAGGVLDGYLAILESFLNETSATSTSATNRPGLIRKPKVAPFNDEE